MERTEQRNMGSGDSRQIYEAPVVIEYGTLRDLTLAVGQKGNDDGGPSSPNKTSI